MGRRPGVSSLASISMSQLQQELKRRQASSKKLLAKRAKLVRELQAIDSELGTGGGSYASGGGGGRTRPKNEMGLVEALSKVLSGKQLRVNDIVDAVQKAGYKTSSANFRTIVNATLIKNKKQFKKVERGVYTAA